MHDFNVSTSYSITDRNSGADVSATTEKAGNYRGLAVAQQKNAADPLSDMEEEISFSFAEKMGKKFVDRKKKADRCRTSLIDAARMMADKLKDMNPQHLQRFLQQLESAGADPEKIKKLLVESFKDSVKQHLALSFAIEQLEEKPELKRLLQKLKDTLETEHGSEIRAGYNIDQVDSDLLCTPGEARKLYKHTVLGHADIGDAFIDMFQQYGAEGFSNAMTYLKKAIGADISAQTPSSERAELEQSNRDLAHVQVLSNIHRDCVALLEKLAVRYGVDYRQEG